MRVHFLPELPSDLAFNFPLFRNMGILQNVKKTVSVKGYCSISYLATTSDTKFQLSFSFPPLFSASEQLCSFHLW